MTGNGRGMFGSTSFSSVETVTGGGGGFNSLTLPDAGATVRLNGNRAGRVLDKFGSLLLTFADIDDVVGGAGDDEFIAEAVAMLRNLLMGGTDRFIVEIKSGGSAGWSVADLLDLREPCSPARSSCDRPAARRPGLTATTPLRFLSFQHLSR